MILIGKERRPAITEVLASYYEPDEQGRRPPECLYGATKMWAYLNREGLGSSKYSRTPVVGQADHSCPVPFAPAQAPSPEAGWWGVGCSQLCWQTLKGKRESCTAMGAKQPPNPESRARDFLVSKGMNPTPKAIATRVTQEADRAGKVAHREAVIGYAIARCGPAAAAYVAKRVAALGDGPYWQELARALEWPRNCTSRIVQGLTAAGWLTCTDQPRSLRPGPRYQETVGSSREPG